MKTPRIRAAGAPSRPGYCTEAELAARWGRKPATLLNWRLRPHADHTPVPFEVIDGWLYYSHAEITAYEADPANARVRPLALRSLPLPPLRAPLAEVSPDPRFLSSSRSDTHPELPLGFGEPGQQIELIADRGFRSIDVRNCTVIAIANDGTAWTADSSVGLEYLEWSQIPDLPCSTRALATLPVHPPRPTAS